MKVIVKINLMSQRSIYFDTYFLLAEQDENEEGRIARNLIGRVENMKNKHHFDLKTPMIALGEAFSKCCFEDYNSEKLTKLIQQKEIDTPTPRTDQFELAIDLINNASILPCDALIAAQALLDPSAEWLLTVDVSLISSRYIQRKIRELKINRVRINDNIGS